MKSGENRLVGKGSIGDAYLFNCILYDPSRKNSLTVEQYALKEFDLIEDIYSLSKNVNVKFINGDEWKKYLDSLPGPFVPGHPPGFRPSPMHCSKRGWVPTTPFPVFHFPETKHKLDNYVAVCPKSGEPRQESRDIGRDELNAIIKKYPDRKFVLLGTDEKYKDFQKSNVVNLVGETSLLEALGIVSRASRFIGIQGLMAYCAMSQRIHSVVYTRTNGHTVAFVGRLFPQWINYCSIYAKSQNENPQALDRMMS